MKSIGLLHLLHPPDNRVHYLVRVLFQGVECIYKHSFYILFPYLIGKAPACL